MYYYFVTFTAKDDKNTRIFGMKLISHHRKISSYRDIQEIKRKLEEETGFSPIVFTSYPHLFNEDYELLKNSERQLTPTAEEYYFVTFTAKDDKNTRIFGMKLISHHRKISSYRDIQEIKRKLEEETGFSPIVFTSYPHLFNEDYELLKNSERQLTPKEEEYLKQLYSED